MTKALADMVAELQEDVPVVDGIPSDAQYERAIKDAIAEFSRRCGLKKVGTLSIVSGTSTYSLPVDFLKLIWLESLTGADDVIIGQKLIPVNANWEEHYTIQNQTITFTPVPGYTLVRELQYKAGWVLDENNAYPLTDDEAEIVMLKAKSICFEKLANATAGAGFRYTVGNMSVDKSGMADGYSKRQSEHESKFEVECDKYNGAAVM